MVRPIVTGRSLKQIKTRARQLRDSHGMTLSSGLEQAAREAGYANYHEAHRVLGLTGVDLAIDRASAALRAIENFHEHPNSESAFQDMSTALRAAYTNDSKGARGVELALVIGASARPDAVRTLAQWLGAWMENPLTEGPHFGMACVLSINCGSYVERTGSAIVSDIELLEQNLESALRLGPALRVRLSPIAMLFEPMEPNGELLGSWAAALAMGHEMGHKRMHDGLVLQRKAGSFSEVGHAIGSQYLVFGWMEGPRALESAATDAMNGPAVTTVLARLEGSAGPFAGSLDLFVPGSQLLAVLYREQIRVLIEELGAHHNIGSRKAKISVTVNVHHAEEPRADPEYHPEYHVDLVVSSPGSTPTSIFLGPIMFPAYLYQAIMSIVGVDVQYNFEGARKRKT